MKPIQKINKVEVRNLQIEDYAQLAQSFTRVYADKDVFWTHEQIEKLIKIFPEGQIVTVVDDKIAGMCTFYHCRLRYGKGRSYVCKSNRKRNIQYT